MFACRLGEFIILGPEATPQDEVVLMLANEATKHLKHNDQLTRQTVTRGATWPCGAAQRP